MRSFAPSFCAACVLALLLGAGAARAAAANLDGVFTALDKAVKDENLDKVKELSQQLAATDDPKYARKIFGTAATKTDMSVDCFNHLVAALAQFDSDDCIKYFLEEAQSKTVSARVLAVDVAAGMTGDKGIAIILAGLKDDTVSVIESALNATLKRKPKDAVPVLIDLIDAWSKKKTKDAVYYNIRQTLIDLTGETMEQIEDWRKWWEASKAKFDPAKVRQEGKRSVRRLGGDDDPQFFGVPISSRNAVFVIDISLSMNLVQKDDIPGLTSVTGADQTKVVEQPKEKLTPENERLARYWSRIEMAKRHLVKVLQGLKSPTRFNVIAFHDKVLKFNKTSLGVAPATQKKCGDWVRNLRTNGNTATLMALKDAFASDAGVNTIYFLSDGLPSKDGVNVDNLEDLLNEIRKLNRFRKIKIHTFGFYPFNMAGFPHEELKRANDFLAKLAQETGGTFTAMKVDPNEKPPKEFR